MYEGTSGVVTGWGTLKEDGKPSCSLQEVELPVISNERCRKSNYTSSMISDNMMCAGYPDMGGKDSCQVRPLFVFTYIKILNNFKLFFTLSNFQGDSGGPMAAERPDHKYEIIG